MMQKKYLLLSILVITFCMLFVIVIGCDSNNEGYEEPIELEEIVDAEPETEVITDDEPMTDYETESFDEVRGNTVGNIVNSGIAAKNDGWYYYINNVGCIFKFNPFSQKRMQINYDRSSNLNAIGDWIYYSNNNNYGKIYKIRTDGTERTKITDDSASYISVVGDWIYYRNNDDDFKLYMIRTDGSERIRLNDESSSFINVVDDWIYYTSGEIYKIRTDGTERTQVNNEDSIYINVVGDWIYYVKNTYFLRGEIYKIRKDGTELTKVIDDNQASRINVVNNWIYYTSEGKLHKVRTNGTEKKQLSDDISESINVVGNWIYYFNSNNYTYNKIGIGGSSQQIVDKKLGLEFPEEIEVIVNVDYLRLRSGPSIDYEILDRLMKEDKLRLNGIENEWLRVITKEGKEGWVHSGYVVSRDDLVKIEINTQTQNPYSHHHEYPETGLEDLGVNYMASIEEINSIMGAPKDTDEYDGGIKGPSIRLEYSGINFGLSKYDDSFCLSSYQISSSKITGPRGIRLGDTVESVISKYLLTNNDLKIWKSPEGIYYSNMTKNSIELYYDEESGPYTKRGSIITNYLTGEISNIVYIHYLPGTCGVSGVSFNIQDGLVEKIGWYDF